jgi:hypothetical protein
MDLKNLSTNGLLLLYEAIRKALYADDRTPSGETKTYGVRETADWRQLADSLDEELGRRGATYDKIPW